MKLEPDNLLATKQLADLLIIRVGLAVSHFQRTDEAFIKLLDKAQTLLDRVRLCRTHDIRAFTTISASWR